MYVCIATVALPSLWFDYLITYISMDCPFASQTRVSFIYFNQIGCLQSQHPCNIRLSGLKIGVESRR
jgi:hypothetical protein